MKRAGIFLIITGLLLSTIAVGCSRVSTGENGEKKDGQVTEKTVQTEKQSEKPTEPVKISVLVKASGLPDPDKNAVLQQLNKDLNIVMELTAIEVEYEAQLNIKIAGGTPPDMFGVDQNIVKDYVRQGVLLELDNYMDKMPNIKTAYKDEYFNLSRVNGKIYAIPRRWTPNQITYLIRQDWLDKLGMKMPETLDELKAVAGAFTNNDPDGNGVKDTYGFTSSPLDASYFSNYSFIPLFTAYGIGKPGSFIIKDNKVVYSTVDPAMKQALAYIKGLLDDGLIDPEFMANQGRKANEKAYQGLAGIVYAAYPEYYKENNVKTIKDINPNAVWSQVSSIQGPGGKYAGDNDIVVEMGISSDIMAAIPKSLEKKDDKFEKVLELLDYLTAPGKGQMLVDFGIEGEHYKLTDGKVEPLPKMSELGYTWIMQLTGRNQMEYMNIKFPYMSEQFQFSLTQPRINTYNSLIPLPVGVVVSDKERYETEEITKFIYGKRGLDEYDKFVDTLYSTYQLQKYIDEAEKTMKELGYIQ